MAYDDYVDRRGPDECWPWTGRRRGGRFNQYGAYGHYQAHRIALERKLGRELEPRMMACHTCDNPICCNPDHLYEGSAERNMRDAYARNRIGPANRKGEANGNAKLTQADADQIKERIKRGETNVAIARDYPVTHQMVSKIRKGAFW